VSTHVNAVLWDPEVPIPLNIEPWAMYEVPRVGDRYWHHRTGYSVREIIDDLTPPEIHLVRDPAWEEAVHGGLPTEYILEGGRRDDDGTWQFHVLSPTTGLPLGAGGYSPDFGTAVEDAITIGHQHHAAQLS
jgi:hypothetical protein